MKKTVIFSALLLSVTAMAQRTPADRPSDFERDPVVSESVRVINEVRSQMQVRAQQSKTGSAEMTEAEYQLLVTRGEDMLLQQNYSQAETIFNEILKNRQDQYAKDKIAEIMALKSRQQKQFEQAKKDVALRAKAETAKGSLFLKRQVHLSGGVMSDQYQVNGTSKAFTDDQYSSFLSVGKYDTLSKVIKKADAQTLDGIAIPANVRVVVYRDRNCKGEVVLDITGPAIVNNMLWTTYPAYNVANTKNYIPEIQELYPQAVRFWSLSDMHSWTAGSMEIMVAEE